MKNESQDVKETKPCKNDHRLQWVEQDKKGHFWQLCVDCDRKLLVR